MVRTKQSVVSCVLVVSSVSELPPTPNDMSEGSIVTFLCHHSNFLICLPSILVELLISSCVLKQDIDTQSEGQRALLFLAKCPY